MKRHLTVTLVSVFVVAVAVNLFLYIRHLERQAQQRRYRDAIADMGEGRMHLALTDLEGVRTNSWSSQDLKSFASILCGYISYRKSSYAQAFKYLDDVRVEGDAAAVQDYIDFLRGEISWNLYQATHDSNYLRRARDCYRRVMETPESPRRHRAWMDYLRCSHAMGDFSYVETLTGDMIDSSATLGNHVRPELLFITGQAWNTTGRVDKGSEYLATLWTCYPGTQWADSAEEELARVKAHPEIQYPALSINELLDVYDNAMDRRYVSRRYRDAAHRAITALAGKATGSTRDRAILALGKIERRDSRTTRQAKRHLAEASGSSDAGIAAQALYYLIRGAAQKQDLSALQSLVTRMSLPKYRQSPFYGKAVYAAGFPFMRKRKYSQAAAIYERVRHAGEADNAAYQDALWRLHWCYYHTHQFDRALEVLGELRTKDPWKEYALYWMAYLYQKTGEQAIARSLYKELLTDYGITYYGVLAKEALKFDFAMDTTVTRNPEEFITETVGLLGDARRHRRYSFLKNNGLYAFAAEELQAYMDENHIKRSANLEDWRPYGSELAKLYFACGEFIKAGTNLSGAYDDYVLKGGINIPEWFWRIYYPLLYTDIIADAANQYGINPTFLYAFIRQESYFEPLAKSSAGAIGVMQIMPGTGKEVFDQMHRSLGLSTFDVDLLYRPEINIPMGVFYLSQQFDKIEKLVKQRGRLPDNNENIVYAMVIAAYNAGARRAKRWLSETEFDNLQELVDQIDIPETRRYVKLVLKHKYLYQSYVANKTHSTN